ncbi:glutathione S-transferase family protein [Thalassospira marina]|uniref:Glutathione S-transferase n=1 Tax=Thalassospira marina TaxID=2048283 RepID=A0ABM6Q4Y4_9PROT|nr:glutathione S-transferase family protein [Thalassospira marina]AUG51433.1 glutathione S-transferase [Thalassospira marina]
MAYDFYWISGSPNAWRTMLTLEYKGIAYNSHRLDPSKGEHKSDAYLAINPRGKVPALHTGTTAIHESIAIIAMLEQAHPEKPLFGETADQAGLVWQRIFETINYTRDPVEDGIVRPLFQGYAQTDRVDIHENAKIARQSLQWIEDTLAQTPYLAGETLSAADICAITTLKVLERAGQRPDAIELGLNLHDIPKHFPAIGRWFARMEQMPGWDAALPPHWKGQ